ncbi:MAG TPA: hemagglutinin repeat-containing protein, partial [Sulfurimonas sp.]
MIKIYKQLLSIITSLLLVFAPALSAAGVEADGTTNTTLESAPNGVDVVNIADPSAQGLSHNRYNHYNVSKEGLILNNSMDTTVKTQLGGFIYGNSHLTSNAKVILNEVTSTNPSQLNGYTEVAGKRADLVIANPNGITLNGAGFINTSNVTLSTGKPIIQNGSISSYGTQIGEISIEGEGLDATQTDSAHLYAKVLRLNANIYANELDAKFGSLDASTLGGMYANAITLEGTDHGVGVNLPPEVVASNGDIIITADGSIKLQKMTAHNIAVQSTQNIELENEIYTSNSARLEAGDEVIVKDGMLASQNSLDIKAERVLNQNILQSTNSLSIEAAQYIQNDADILSDGLLQLVLNGELINNGQISANDLEIGTDTFTNNQTLFAANDMNLYVSKKLQNNQNANIFAFNNLTIAANKANEKTNIIENISGIIQTYNGVLNIQTNELINEGIIKSGSDMTIESTQYIQNDAEILSDGLLQLISNGELINNALISGSDIDVEADIFTNNQTFFAANDMNLYVSNKLQNNQNANIFAFNNLTMARNNANEKTDLIENISANIETYRGDINIFAKQLINKRVKDVDDNVFFTSNSFSDTVYFNESIGYSRSSIVGENGLLLLKGLGFNDRFDAYISSFGYRLSVDLAREPFNTHFATIGAVLNEKLPYDDPNYGRSTILAGNDLHIVSDSVVNEISDIVSTNDMYIDAGSFENREKAYEGTLSLTLYNSVDCDAEPERCLLYDGYSMSGVQKKRHDGWLYQDGKLLKYAAYYGDYTYGPYAVKRDDVSLPANVSAGGSIYGNINTLNNGTIQEDATILKSVPLDISSTAPSQNMAEILLPQDDNGFFVLSKEPQSSYLIETNPEFTIYENFISSDYMLEHIGYDAEATTKRLGNALYENRLVRDSVLEQTGQRFLKSEFTSDNEQYKYLMENAIQASQDLQLTPGIALTKEQINALSKDIVWMQEQEVQGEKVLVPVVYIANAQNYKLKGARIVAAENIDINTAELNNAGTIKADNINAVATESIKNIGGDIEATQDMALQATNDITNTSASIKADNIELTSIEGSIINDRAQNEVSWKKGMEYSNYTLTGEASSIEAANTLSINANKNLHVTGSSLSAKELNIAASDVEIKTTEDKSDFFIGDSDNYNKANFTKHLSSNINADNVNIDAIESVKVIGSNIDAEGDIDIRGKKLDVLAVNNSSYSEIKRTKKGTFSTKSTTTKQATSTNIASEITAANINLATTNDDIDVIGSKLQADDTLSINSANDINVQAGYNGSMNESHTTKSGWFSGGSLYSKSEDLEGKLTKTAINSSLSGTNIELVSKENIDMVGVNMQADNMLSASAQGIEIKNATNTEETYSKHKKIDVGLGDAIKTLSTAIVNPFASVEYDKGKASITLAKATYDNETKVTKKTTVASSNIDATNININASSSKIDKGDILIQGSNLSAQDEINLQATNDITIKEAKETTDIDSKEAHGKAELKATLKNEYVQIGYVVDDAAKATEALKKAKDDYSRYKDYLSTQEEKLSELKRDLSEHKLGIEQADIDDMQYYVDELRSDDEYYLANIALATTTLATKLAAVYTQTKKAASSSATLGFNAGLELDIDAIEKQLQEYKEQSIASNISADNINLNAGSKATIQGSNLAANNEININAKDTDILASKDISNTQTGSSHKNITIGYEVYGGLSTSTSADTAQSTASTVTHNNSVLQANDININTTDDTTIKGANIYAQDELSINTGNLEVSSVQNRTTSNANSKSVNLSTSGFTPTGIGGSVSKSSSAFKETLLTTVTGGRVDINTAENTTLKGATIAGVDEDGNDNGQLKLTTNTLNVSSLNNTSNSKSLSMGASIGGSYAENNLENFSMDFSKDSTNSKTKTLATIGSGDVQVTDKENSDTAMLNRDITDNEVDIYDISSHKGLHLELDMRLLSEDGRNEIAEDILKSGMIVNTISLIASSQKVGITDFFSETEKSYKTYEAVKEKVATSPELAEALNNPDLTPAQKEQMLSDVTDTVMVKLGYTTYDNKIISTDVAGKNNEQVKGYYSEVTKDAYINDKYNDSTKELISTAGHEATHAMDLYDNAKSEETYSNVYGDNLALYTDFVLSITGQGSLADTNYHNDGRITSTPSVFNTIDRNNAEFNGLDKEVG